MKKILYIAPHRKNRSPGQRFRFEQYIKYFEQNGYVVSYSNLLNKYDDKNFYSKGKYFIKLYIFFKSIGIRIYDIIRAPQYNIIIIYREAFMLGTIIFEKLLHLTAKKIIYDFDDSIWLNDVSEGNYNLQWLKRPSKTADIIKLSNLTIVGNKFLANYALQFNNNVKIIPTTIDINYHIKKNYPKNNKAICIGWTGTSTTLKHFETAHKILEHLYQKYHDKIYFKIIIDIPYACLNIPLKVIQWNLSTEIDDLLEFDIGIMPLPDDEWSKGKCGFKGLQYMALEIPTIMSPVGVNCEIINDGINGFLANTYDEWIEKLSKLIELPELRTKLGKEGRKTVVEKYSVQSQQDKYLQYLNELTY